MEENFKNLFCQLHKFENLCNNIFVQVKKFGTQKKRGDKLHPLEVSLAVL